MTTNTKKRKKKITATVFVLNETLEILRLITGDLLRTTGTDAAREQIKRIEKLQARLFAPAPTKKPEGKSK